MFSFLKRNKRIDDNMPIKVDKDSSTVKVMQEQLSSYMDKYKISSRATAMEIMREDLYKYFSKEGKIPLDDVKDFITIIFEV